MPVQPIGAVSPSLVNALLACPARVYLDARDTRSGRPTRSSALLGSAVHAALEELVLTGSIWDDDLRTTVKLSWVRALGALATSTNTDLSTLPGFFIKQARLEATARRLRSLLLLATRVETELWLESSDKTVRGRLDLAIHTPGGAWIVDSACTRIFGMHSSAFGQRELSCFPLTDLRSRYPSTQPQV
jgi:hypothetical protein